MRVNIQLWIFFFSMAFRCYSTLSVSLSSLENGRILCTVECALTWRRHVAANQPIPAVIWVSLTWHGMLVDSTLVNKLARSPVSTATPSLPFLRVLNGSGSICFLSSAGTFAGKFASQIRDTSLMSTLLVTCVFTVCSLPNGSKLYHSACFSLLFSLDGCDSCLSWHSSFGIYEACVLFTLKGTGRRNAFVDQSHTWQSNYRDPTTIQSHVNTPVILCICIITSSVEGCKSQVVIEMCFSPLYHFKTEGLDVFSLFCSCGEGQIILWWSN